MEKEIVSIISSLCIIPLNGLLKFLRDGNDTPTKLHVIDASVVAGTEDFDFTKWFTQISKTNDKVLITSITLREINNLQNISDYRGESAKYVMSVLAKNPKHVKVVLIDEPFELPDDNIIKFCSANKADVILYTADKDMALKARMYGVETKFYTQKFNADITNKDENTLRIIKTDGRNFTIWVGENSNKSILLISDGVEYRHGIHKLKINDDIYVATKKEGYYTFIHFRVTALKIKDNCKIICHKRVCDKRDIKNLPSADYRTFMREFYRKSNED